MSLFISFEGGEGSGKTTQAEILKNRLEQIANPVVLGHEPGTTSLGDYLRAWLKRGKRREETMSHTSELFLFVAARADFVAKVLKPALELQNMVVIADRYADSTTAYQGYGRRLRLRDVAMVNRMATDGIMPDSTILLDCDPIDGLERVQMTLPVGSLGSSGAKRMDQEGTRRFEEESLDFHKRVRAGYLRLADQEPNRWSVIDATKGVKEISAEIWGIVQNRLSQDERPNSDPAGPELPLWRDKDDTNTVVESTG